MILKAHNTVLTKEDLIGHAEVNLIQEAAYHYDVEFLKTCTIYTSDEPCAMCASAIYWAGIKRLVFGLSKQRFYQEFGKHNPDWTFELSSIDVLSKVAERMSQKIVAARRAQ
ncbi:MAG: nucleoside deaminase [Gammaproteobacteria bacterium]|nr:nucleoside deaminase [Gammaproteobacteria bacterium]